MSIIKKFIPPIFIDIYRKLRTRNGKYEIGKYEVKIPPNFALPSYQKQFRLYDRFLPVLAKSLPYDKIIIDVGANIGDTAIAILQHCNNPIICFEPSDIFFPYLEDNIKLLSPNDFIRVKTFKTLVGTGKLKGELKHYLAGTAKIIITDNSTAITHITLDNKIVDSSNVVLIKVDTDGFDFDVIQSADKICSESEPILFWENEISEDFQYRGFNELYSWLKKRNYKYVYIFDNFGNLMAEECDFETLRNLNSYIYTMQKNECTRTIYYTDILATTEKYRFVAKNAITEYKTVWINK